MKRKLLPTRVVLFDWDGTLLDSFTADTRAYIAMFAALGIRWTSRDLARHYHPDWYRVYRAAKLHRSRWGQADKIWREAYGKESPKLLPASRKVLCALAKRFTLGIVTSGDGDRVRLQLRNLGLSDAFAVCVCAEDAAHRKPHPAPLRRALELLRTDPCECVYVGDSPQDIEMARRAGVRAIGVFGPFPTALGLRVARPELLLDSVSQLPGHLEAMPKKPSAAKAISMPRAATRQKKEERRAPRKRHQARRSGA